MEKKQTLYEISQDLIGLNELLENLVDEEGNPREPNEDELNTLKTWFENSQEDFNLKFDNYCKFIKNLKIKADIVDSERKAYKAELDRLAKRAKAFTNKAKTIQSLLQWNMDIIKCPKFKTDLFTATIQNTQISVEALVGDKLENVPEDFLKPRELDTTKIKDAIKAGKLETRPNDPNPLNRSKIYVVETGEEIPGIRWHNNETLVIR